MQLTKNFHLSEFESKDGSPMPKEVYLNVVKLANQLQTLRDYLCFSIKINSGYRSPEHNRSIGGAFNSFHLFGMASDIYIKEMKSIDVYNEIEFLISQGVMLQGGLGLYDTFVHYDIRKKKARW